MSEKNIQKCIFCNKNIADTRDHIFSRSLFPSSLPVDYNGYTAPACSECNSSFSLDEELFRNLITALGYDNSNVARELWETKVKKSARRRPALAQSIFSRMELVDFYSAGGIYLGKRTKMTIDVDIKKRINQVLVKYTRGLFYKHFDSEIPGEYTIKVVWAEEIQNIPNLLGKIKPTARIADVLSYGYGHVKDTYNSVWLYLFYQKMPFLVFVVDDAVTNFKK